MEEHSLILTNMDKTKALLNELNTKYDMLTKQDKFNIVNNLPSSAEELFLILRQNKAVWEDARVQSDIVNLVKKYK